MSQSNPTTYNQGYHKSVTANHAVRTAEYEGAHLLPHLQPHHRILDIGCGPGSITVGFAKYVPNGHVIGVDLAPQVIAQANEHLASQEVPAPPTNLTFTTGNVLEGLPYEDGEFDVVFSNQVLLHIPDPVAAMREMRRVCKKESGLVVTRDGDFPFRFYPYLEGVQLFNKYLFLLVQGDGCSAASSFSCSSSSSALQQPDNQPHSPDTRTGSLAHVWARKAGFEVRRIEKSAQTQVYGTGDERAFFAGVMTRRIEEAGHREKFLERGASAEEVDTMVRDLGRWAEDGDGWGAIVHCCTVCRM